MVHIQTKNPLQQSNLIKLLSLSYRKHSAHRRVIVHSIRLSLIRFVFALCGCQSTTQPPSSSLVSFLLIFLASFLLLFGNANALSLHFCYCSSPWWHRTNPGSTTSTRLGQTIPRMIASIISLSFQKDGTKQIDIIAKLRHDDASNKLAIYNDSSWNKINLKWSIYMLLNSSSSSSLQSCNLDPRMYHRPVLFSAVMPFFLLLLDIQTNHHTRPCVPYPGGIWFDVAATIFPFCWVSKDRLSWCPSTLVDSMLLFELLSSSFSQREHRLL